MPWFKSKWILSLVLAVVVIYTTCFFAGSSSAIAATENSQIPPTNKLTLAQFKTGRFPDFGCPPPQELDTATNPKGKPLGVPDFCNPVSDPEQPIYDGELFKLSQDYPKKLPDYSEMDKFFQNYPQRFQSNSTTTNPEEQDWYKYMIAVRDYSFDGNLDIDWRVEKNQKRAWYHMPWMHYGTPASDGIHGLIQEAPLQAGQLGPDHKNQYTAYAASFYNDFGGYHIGNVWKDAENPNPSADDSTFPRGTVITKLLFTDAPVSEVPYLKGTVEWDAYVAPSKADPQPRRKITTVRLIQMDIMLRDPLAPTGWSFGTFVYNSALGNQNPWYKLQPVGLQWGDDPNVTDDLYNPTPTETKTNPNIKETVINISATPALPPQHLGWGFRLSGPVDNAKSSCMSCHSTAQYPVIQPLAPAFIKPKPPKPGSPEWMKFFRNLNAGEPFDSRSISTDFSLLLNSSINNYYQWKNDNIQGFYVQEFPGGGQVKTYSIHRQLLEPREEVEARLMRAKANQ